MYNCIYIIYIYIYMYVVRVRIEAELGVVPSLVRPNGLDRDRSLASCQPAGA
jgi:hypothetical protein